MGTPAASTDELLRGAGLRSTRPRRAVLALMDELGGHRSVDELLAVLSRRGIRLARTSVYNVVDDLTAVGLLAVADTGPGRTLYEVPTTAHHHFVCRACGEVTDVACAAAPSPCVHAHVDGFDGGLDGGVVDQTQIIFRGTCGSCRVPS